MRPKTALSIVAALAAVMILQAFVLTFWCESASVFSFRVEDLTFTPTRVFPVSEFKSTIPGMLVFATMLALAWRARQSRPVSLFGTRLTPQHQVAAIVLLTAWNLLFAAFLVGLEFAYLTPCPV